jgi:hypothetical protein
VLAAVGFDSLLVRSRPRLRSAPFWLLAGAALPLWWYGQDWNPAADPRILGYRPAALRSPALTRHTTPIRAPSAAARLQPEFGRIFASVHDIYWKRFVSDGYHDYGGVTARPIDAFIDSMLPNLPMRYGQEEGGGYEPIAVAAATGVNDLARIALQRGEPNASRLLQVMDVGTVVTPESGAIVDSRLTFVDPLRRGALHGVAAFENRDRSGRAWLVRRTRSVQGHLRVTAALSSPDFRPAELAILSDAASCKEPDLDALPCAGSTAVTGESAHRVALFVDAGSSPALVVYSGVAYPGWSARLDGRPAPIHCADGAFVGLRVGPGRHVATLIYAPASVRVGGFGSLCGLCALSGAAGAAGAARLRRRAQAGQAGVGR